MKKTNLLFAQLVKVQWLGKVDGMQSEWTCLLDFLRKQKSSRKYGRELLVFCIFVYLFGNSGNHSKKFFFCCVNVTKPLSIHQLIPSILTFPLTEVWGIMETSQVWKGGLSERLGRGPYYLWIKYFCFNVAYSLWKNFMQFHFKYVIIFTLLISS